MEATSEKTAIDTFLEQFSAIEDTEEKLKKGVGFMRTSLSEGSTPYFKGFWEVRKRCLPLFKEVKNSPARAKLWEEYIELTREGRRLKHLMDEESAFAVEQIDLAVCALEKEVDSPSQNSRAPLPPCKTLQQKLSDYQSLCDTLSHFNTLAARINSLRKELIHQPMRIRQKNQFFDRLSKLGDAVFPPRKEKIKEVSDLFINDVEDFVAKHFTNEVFSRDEARGRVFFLREEIKSLQKIAGHLTLNTEAFKKTRESLSGCWDQLRGLEKEFKQEAAAHREKSAKNAEAVREKMGQFAEKQLEGAEAKKQLDEISAFMREVVLTRDDVRALKDELRQLWDPIFKKEAQEAEAKKAERAEKEKLRKEQYFALKESIDRLKEESDFSVVEKQVSEIEKQMREAELNSQEREQLRRALKRLVDQMSEAKEKALLETLSDSDRASIDQLNELLENRVLQKKEIKQRLDELRKEMGGSGQDFERAMALNEQMEEEKALLHTVEKAICEIENKLATIKNGS